MSNARPRTYSTREVAERLGVSVQTVQRWVDAGQLKAWKTLGGHRRIDLDSAEALLRGEVDWLPQAKPREDSAQPRGRPESLRVLVVDDELDDRTILGMLVNSIMPTAKVEEAETGFGALLSIGQNMPDVLIVDIAMPHMDGLQMLRHLAERSVGCPALILVITHLSEDEVRSRGGLPPGTLWMPKPVDRVFLQQALRDCLSRLNAEAA